MGGNSAYALVCSPLVRPADGRAAAASKNVRRLLVTGCVGDGAGVESRNAMNDHAAVIRLDSIPNHASHCG